VKFYEFKALRHAVFGGREDAVRTLVQEGIDVTLGSGAGTTAFQIDEVGKMYNITALLGCECVLNSGTT
jgi:hypothetical protein